MPKTFAMFTACSLASLALPGMSGFIAELMVFVGFLKSSVYSINFKIVLTIFEAFGIILTPIYLLSMLRQVFYGASSVQISFSKPFFDASPREIFIISCLLIPIIGLGIYPDAISQIYSFKTDNLINFYLTDIYK